jgi:hypothetical protein
MELLIELLLAELVAVALRLALVRIFSWFRDSSHSLLQLALSRGV